MSDTYSEIAARLAELQPPVRIADHIGDRRKLKVATSVLDGITFPPKDKNKLLEDASGIGTRDGWAKRLADRGFSVKGHRLVKAPRPTEA